MDLLYSSTTISIDNWKIAPFGGSYGSMVGNPKTLPCSFMRLLLGKDGMWNKPHAGITWISKIKMDINLTIPHIREFIILWRSFLM
jgi:hypothetical protein